MQWYPMAMDNPIRQQAGTYVGMHVLRIYMDMHQCLWLWAPEFRRGAYAHECLCYHAHMLDWGAS